jgi:hypothetical protein
MAVQKEHSMSDIYNRVSHRIATIFSFGNVCTLLLTLSGIIAVFFAVEAVRFLRVTGENIYPEAAGVLAAQRWAHGLPLYGDYRQPPYLMTAFPPLWYAFIAAGAKAGLSSLDSLTAFGRILSIASLFGVVVLAFLWNRRLGFSIRFALLAPALYLCFPVLIPWAVTARPDFPALLFSFFAVYIVGLRSGTTSICIAGIAAALGFLIRHNSVAAPVAIVLWLLWSRRWKNAALFCAIWAVVVAVPLLLLQLSSHGLLLLNMSSAKFGPMAPTYIRGILHQLFVSEGHGFAILLLVFGVFGFLTSLEQTGEGTRLLNVYFVLSLGLAVIGSATAGAGVNHYLEPVLTMAVLVPTGLAHLQSAWKSDSPLASFAVLMIVAVLLPSIDVQRWKAMHRKPENLQRIMPLIENRHVFTDDPYLAARMAFPQAIDLASLINTERAGGWAAWSSSQLAKSLQERRYDLVILRTPLEAPFMPYNPTALYPRAPRLDSIMQTAIAENYRLCFEVHGIDGYGSLYVYSPTRDYQKASSCPPSSSNFDSSSLKQQRQFNDVGLR